MRFFLRRRPSGAMVVAMIALILAASGTAIAASKLVNGDKLIKKRSLSANRLRNHTITGTQVNLKKLGKVPNAKHADSATTASTATNAGSAANVAGVSRFIKTIAPAGTTVATAARVALGSSGPLTVYGYCYMNGANTHAATYLVSSVAGFYNKYSGVNGTGTALLANTPVDVGYADADAPPGTESWANPYDGTFSGITGTLSNYITGLVSNGVNLTSANACTFAGFTSAS